MKKRVISIASLLVVAAAMVGCNSNKGNTEKNIEGMKDNEIAQLCSGMVAGIVDNDASFLTKEYELFENATYERMMELISKSKFNGGDIVENVCDIVRVDKSSTEDMVIFVNSKVAYDDTYKIVYSFEFHINKQGKIYGFNVWIY
jgi:hypothetical protein